MFSFVRNCQSAFHSVCTIFYYYQRWMRILVALHLHQQFLLPLLLNFNYFNRCMMVSCCFNLNFPNDRWCRSSFHMYICYLYIFFDEVFRYFAHILIGLFFLTIVLPLDSRVLCIFWVKISCQICVLQIFSQIHGFFFLTVSFEEQTFLILIKFYLPIFFFHGLCVFVVSKHSTLKLRSCRIFPLLEVS